MGFNSAFKELRTCVLYIGRAYRYLPDVAFYIFFSTTISTEYFKHAAHSPFFSSKCRLFHNVHRSIILTKSAMKAMNHLCWHICVRKVLFSIVVFKGNT